MTQLAWTLSLLRPYRVRVVVIAILAVFEIGLGVLAPWPLKVVVDNVLGGGPLPEPLAAILPSVVGSSAVALLLVIVVSGLLLQIASEVVAMFHTQIQVDTGQRLVYDLRSTLLSHLQALPLRHHLLAKTADSVYRLESDAYCVSDLVLGGVFPLATAAIKLTVMFVILVRLDATLALLSLTVAPFLYGCLRYYSVRMTNRAERVKSRESELIERAYEIMSSISAIKSFARETHELARFVKAGADTMTARLRLTWQESLFSVTVTAITLTGTALVLVVGGLHVMDGRLTVGGLLVVIAYLAAVYNPLSSIASTIGSLQQAIVSARRVREILALAPEQLDAPGALDATGIAGHIRFERVSFAYDDQQPVLQDVSFLARPGEMVALVGLTGAGKTTLASLIPRFFDPTAGRVLVDGVEVSRYSLKSLRERIALVPQEPVLFTGTIADNIRYGRLEASNEEVEAAARAAHVHQFVQRLPKAYDAQSGGNRGHALGWRAPAPGDRTGPAEGRAHSHPRRADLVARRHLGGSRFRRAAPAARRPYHDRHRPPAVHNPRRNTHPRSARGTAGRAGHARRAHCVERPLSADVRAPLHRSIARRARVDRRAIESAGVKIVFAGIIARYPFGGVTWCSLMYLLGLRALGHEVFYVEDTGECIYDPEQNMRSLDPSYGTRYIHAALAPFGLGDRWSFVNYDGVHHGASREALRAFCADADLFINLSGGSWFWRDEYARIPRRVFVDSDPVFTQLAIAKGEGWYVDFFRGFDYLFTFGANIGTPASDVPTGEFTWHKTWQPVVTDLWRTETPPEGDRFTTVMTWKTESFTDVDGNKDREFVRFIDLPGRTRHHFELAVNGPENLLREHGWSTVDALGVSRSLWDYREFIQGSKGEFAVAKHAYVSRRSGWFSDRTECYLAAGRPALVQDTGWSAHLPATAGLIGFATPEEALDGLDRIDRDYAVHARGAVEIARSCFDASQVLPRLLETACA